jgi:hypothetical protein
MSEKEFNDAVLKQGPIPVEYVRAALENIALTRESKAEWRFGE